MEIANLTTQDLVEIAKSLTLDSWSIHDKPIRDADTILEDILENTESQISGRSLELLKIWEHSADRKSVELIFESFTGVSFRDYLERCIQETTRPTPGTPIEVACIVRPKKCYNI